MAKLSFPKGIDIGELLSLGPTAWAIVLLIVKASKKTSPGGKRWTKAERQAIVHEICELAEELGDGK